jgi:hypothetical protein
LISKWRAPSRLQLTLLRSTEDAELAVQVRQSLEQYYPVRNVN